MVQSGPHPLQGIDKTSSKKKHKSKLFKDEGYTGWLRLYAPREDDPPPPRRTKPTERQVSITT